MRGRRDDERHDRADQHHALDAEIEHAGALGDELSGARQYQRGTGGERERNQRDELVDHAGAGSSSLATVTVRRSFSRKSMKTSAASRKNRSIPWNRPVTAEGSANPICAASPPR